MPKVVVDGNDPGVNSDELEALQDVEMAEAFAPQALTTLYTSANTDLQGGLFLAIQRAVDDNAVAILNISFGNCEQNLGAATNAFLNEIYEQAAAQGISITVSTGDSGSAGCDADTVGFEQQLRQAWPSMALHPPLGMSLSAARTSMYCSQRVFRRSNSTSRFRPPPRR